MPDNVHEQVLKWRVDSGSQSAAQTSVDQLARRYAALKAEMVRLQSQARSLQRAYASQNTDLSSIAKNTIQLKRTTADLRDVERDLQNALSGSNAEYAERARLEKQLQVAQRAQGEQARLYGDVESRTRAITGAVGYFGGEGVERNVNFGAEVLASVEAVKLLKLELPKMIDNLGLSRVAVGGLALALGVSIIAFQKMKEAIKDSGEATRAYLKDQESFFELIKTGTESELRAAIDEKRQALEIAQARQSEIKYILDAAEKTEGFAGALIKLDDAFNTNLGGSRDLEQAGNDLRSEIGELERQIRTLDGALTSGASAAAEYQRQIEQQAKATVEAAELVSSILASVTPDSYKAAVGQINEQIRAAEIQREILSEAVSIGENAQGQINQANIAIEGMLNRIVTGPDITPEQRALNQEMTAGVAQWRQNIEVNKQYRDGLIAEADAAKIQIDAIDAQIRIYERQLTALNEYGQGMEQVEAVLGDFNRAQKVFSDAQSLSLKQAEDELAKNQRLQAQTLETIERLEALGLENEFVAQSVEDLRADYGELIERQYELSEAIIPAIKARDEEVARLKELTAAALATGKALGDMGKSVFYLNQAGTADKRGSRLSDLGKQIQEENDAARERLEAVRDFKREAIQLEEDRLIELRQDEEDHLRKRSQDMADHYRDLADLDADYYQDRADILADLGEQAREAEKERVDALVEANKEAQRATEDHLDRMNDINRDAQRDVRRAAMRLDAVGVREAQLRQQDALEDENEQYEKEKERREEDFRDRLEELGEQQRENERAGRERLADLKRQHDQERSERIFDFNLKLAREDQERAIELQRETDAWNLENNRRQQSLLDQQNMTAGAFLTLYNTVDAGWASIEDRFAAGMAVLGSLTPSGVGGALASLGGLPAFDRGGFMQHDGLAHLRRNEFVMTPEVAQAASRYVGGALSQQSLMQAMKAGGVNINSLQPIINIDRAGSRTDYQIQQLVRAGLLQALQEAAA